MQWVGDAMMRLGLGKGFGLGCTLLAALAPSACDDEQLVTGDAGSAGSHAAGSGGSQQDGSAAAGGSGGGLGGSGGSAGSTSEDAASDALADVSSGGGDAGADADVDAADAGDAADAMSLLMPDFGLYDLNPNSASYQALVSPKNYQGKISAWYFGHAT